MRTAIVSRTSTVCLLMSTLAGHELNSTRVPALHASCQACHFGIGHIVHVFRVSSGAKQHIWPTHACQRWLTSGKSAHIDVYNVSASHQPVRTPLRIARSCVAETLRCVNKPLNPADQAGTPWVEHRHHFVKTII